MIAWLVGWAAGSSALGGTFEASRFDEIVELEVGYDYLLSFPAGYEKDAGQKWPLIVFLHGAGERGDELEDVAVHGPLKRIAEGQEIPAIVVAPQAKNGTIWEPHAVKALTDAMVIQHRVDEARIYLTGLSMGGFGTWDTALCYPQTYAAIAPICGGAGVRFVMAGRLKDVPVWIFHGDADKTVSVENSIKMEKALRKVGGSVKVTLYEGVGHDSWTQTYEDPVFWDWLFAQQKS